MIPDPSYLADVPSAPAGGVGVPIVVVLLILAVVVLAVILLIRRGKR